MPRLVYAVVLMLAATALAQPAPKPFVDPAFEQRVRTEIAAVSPEAATAYDEGNVAREANRHDDAISAYRRGIAIAPNVDHLHRRLCSELTRKNQFDEAIAACERARSLAPASPYNKSALAMALLGRAHDGDPATAVELARDAAAAAPTDVVVMATWCGASLQTFDLATLQTCDERLLQLDPDGIAANLFATFLAQQSRDFDEARRRLVKAKAAGLDQATFDRLSRSIEEQDKDDRAIPEAIDDLVDAAPIIIGTWFLLLLAFYVLGLELSKATLRTAGNTAADGSGTARERRLRRAYKAVLVISGLFFYASLPIMLGTVIAAGCIALAIFDAMGAIPIVVIWLVGAMILGTVIAIVRSVFVPRESAIEGTRVDFAGYPELRAILDDAAKVVGTRPVDVAYLVPGTELCVMQRGGVWASLRGKRSERVLILGVGLFDGMTRLQLRSMIAHEYGHFRNQDTAGGGFALAVRRSLTSLMTRLKPSLFNPVWWCMRAFTRMYFQVSQGASRLQEVLADRWAIHAYGSDAFVAGIRHTISRTAEFNADLSATVEEILENQWSLPNFYDYEPAKKLPEAKLTAIIEHEMRREPTEYDSHPSPRQRVEWAEQHAAAREPRSDDDATVWSLVAGPERLEREMTATIRAAIQKKYGVHVSDADYDDSGDGDGSAPATPVTST